MNDIFLIQGSTLTDTADTIRKYIGGGKISPEDFPEKIDEVYDEGKGDAEPNLQNKTITTNGEHTADYGYDGLGTVTVNVNDAPELQEKTVTPTTQAQTVTPDSNYDGLSKVTVNAAPLQTKNITANGEYTPDAGKLGFSSVTVNVADTPCDHKFTTKTIDPATTTKTYDASNDGVSGYSAVTVNATPLQTKSITANGTYTPDAGKLGFSEVTVDVADTPCNHTFGTKKVKPTTSETTYNASDDNYSGYDTFTVEAMPTGSVEISGGGLTPGDGAVTVQGNNVTLQEISDPSSSKYYIAASGTGVVKRDAITKTQDEGYIGQDSGTEIIAEASLRSDIATKCYAIPAGEITVAAYGIADTTVNTEPGDITITNIDEAAIDNKTRIDTSPKTTTDFTDKYYIAVKASSEANDTDSAEIAGAVHAKVSTSGYVTASDHSIAGDPINITATANVAAAESFDYYLPIQEGSVEVTGGDLTVTITEEDNPLSLFASSDCSSIFEAVDTQPASGAYINIFYNNSIKRDTIEINTEKGYILDSTDTINAKTVYLNNSLSYKIKDAGGWYADRPSSTDGSLTFKIGASTAGIINGEVEDRVSLEDSNFTASNIKAGVSIFGLTGSCLSWESSYDIEVNANTADSTTVLVFTSSLDGTVRDFVSSDPSIATGDWYGNDDYQEMYVRGHKVGDCVIIVTSNKGAYKVLKVHVAQAE